MHYDDNTMHEHIIKAFSNNLVILSRTPLYIQESVIPRTANLAQKVQVTLLHTSLIHRTNLAN